MIEIIMSFDIEFSIGGAFTDPTKYTPLGKDYVWLTKQGESLGLGYILNTLTKNNLRGVFFVETCNTAYHGLEEMGDIAKQIFSEGHDVQLHTHPAWLHYSTLESWPINDSCAGRTPEELTKLFEHGIETFENWELARPIAIRSGGLKVDQAYYEALNASQIDCSSSIGMSIFKPASPEFHVYAGAKLIYGKPEIPITTSNYTIGGRKRAKSLQILSCSLSEMIEMIEQAEAENISPVVILGHPFEFVFAENFRYAKYIKNNVVRDRFEGLCRYLSENRSRYHVTTFSEWKENDTFPSVEYMATTTKSTTAIKRMIENKLVDTTLKFKLSSHWTRLRSGVSNEPIGNVTPAPNPIEPVTPPDSQ